MTSLRSESLILRLMMSPENFSTSPAIVLGLNFSCWSSAAATFTSWAGAAASRGGERVSEATALGSAFRATGSDLTGAGTGAGAGGGAGWTTLTAAAAGREEEPPRAAVRG